MKIKIKKEGKAKEFTLINSWEDVTLDNWLKLIEFQKETKSKQAKETIGALSNIPKKLIEQLELKDVAIIMEAVSELQIKEDSPLKRIIEIEGKRYGFHPDLSSITLGEWADLETFIKTNMEKQLPEVMAILYRPIVEEKNEVYTIEAYDGNIAIRAEEMKKMSSQQVQSALVFFYHFVTLLSMTSALSLIRKLQETKMQ
jgi:hypothetical protein